MTLPLNSNQINSYTLWLQNHQYQSNTIRNYLQDLKTFLTFSKGQISLETISQYFDYVSSKNNSRRYLASLSNFCQFLSDQHLTEVNLFKQSKKHFHRQPSLDMDKLLIQYESYLTKDNKSNLTIKNYLNDLRQYLNWLKNYETGN